MHFCPLHFCNLNNTNNKLLRLLTSRRVGEELGPILEEVSIIDKEQNSKLIPISYTRGRLIFSSSSLSKKLKVYSKEDIAAK